MPKQRCIWTGNTTLYQEYHDTEWGVPEYNDRALFEKLILDGFQAGLSWITILRKRDTFIKAFDGFNPEAIVDYDSKKIDELMNNQGIVRNKAKILGTIANAKIYLDINAKQGFANYLWSFVDGKPIQNNFSDNSQVPSETEVSKKISKDLKQKGGKFCGPTIVYAFMQAVGMVNDHTTNCFRHKECQDLSNLEKNSLFRCNQKLV